jgi:hypothetical protein
MKGQHSPGPWHRNIPPATKYVTIYRGRNTHVCDVIPSRSISPEEAEANLTMIAAGPTMLAALKDVVGTGVNNLDVDGICMHCGRDNSDHRDDPCSDDCPGEVARTALQVAYTGRAE